MTYMDIKRGARMVKKWEKEGYGFKFVPFSEKDKESGYFQMGWRIEKVKLPKDNNENS